MDADHIAAAACFGIAALLQLPSLIVRTGATETDAEARRESPSETAHRIDAEALAATTGCDEACGERCDTCDDRMCAIDGPEPRACGTTCGDCPCDCTSCAQRAQDLQDERAFAIARDERTW